MHPVHDKALLTRPQRQHDGMTTGWSWFQSVIGPKRLRLRRWFYEEARICSSAPLSSVRGGLFACLFLGQPGWLVRPYQRNVMAIGRTRDFRPSTLVGRHHRFSPPVARRTGVRSGPLASCQQRGRSASTETAASGMSEASADFSIFCMVTTSCPLHRRFLHDLLDRL